MPKCPFSRLHKPSFFFGSVTRQRNFSRLGLFPGRPPCLTSPLWGIIAVSSSRLLSHLSSPSPEKRTKKPSIPPIKCRRGRPSSTPALASPGPTFVPPAPAPAAISSSSTYVPSAVHPPDALPSSFSPFTS
ncbi:hypothetical protein ILYODFUR_037644 [Ilyodon furcidens]|uniref:Uncharacterized protein n=1 Tax=Ilyodon furcidens TaxID=33524 RepID=A0ABV0SSE7_9TELE